PCCSGLGAVAASVQRLEVGQAHSAAALGIGSDCRTHSGRFCSGYPPKPVSAYSKCSGAGGGLGQRVRSEKRGDWPKDWLCLNELLLQLIAISSDRRMD